jgi:hypothetical protein
MLFDMYQIKQETKRRIKIQEHKSLWTIGYYSYFLYF